MVLLACLLFISSCFAKIASDTTGLVLMKRYNVSELALPFYAPIWEAKGQFFFYNAPLAELAVFDTATQETFFYGRKYFADSTKLLNTSLSAAFETLKIYKNVLSPLKMYRFFVKNAFIDKHGIFLLVQIPNVKVIQNKDTTRNFSVGSKLAIAEVTPEKVISCHFIKDKEKKDIYVDNYSTFVYKHNTRLFSLSHDTLLANKALLGSFK